MLKTACSDRIVNTDSDFQDHGVRILSVYILLIVIIIISKVLVFCGVAHLVRLWRQKPARESDLFQHVCLEELTRWQIFEIQCPVY